MRFCYATNYLSKYLIVLSPNHDYCSYHCQTTGTSFNSKPSKHDEKHVYFQSPLCLTNSDGSEKTMTFSESLGIMRFSHEIMRCVNSVDFIPFMI